MYNYNYVRPQIYPNYNRLYRESSKSNNVDLFTPNEGYMVGNMFRNLYDQYKNFKPAKLTGKNEKEKMLIDLDTICFAIHDLNLYLDVYPNDNSMLMLFNDYKSKKEELTKRYEEKYGPLSIDGEGMDQVPFKWEEKAWPWEGGF